MIEVDIGSGHLKKILLPLDDSDIAAEILPVISQLAKRLNAAVLLHSVIDPMAYKPLLDGLSIIGRADGFTANSQPQRSLPSLDETVPIAIVEEKANRYLARIAFQLAQCGVEARALITNGEPADEIARQAELNQCDLIAMSTHGRNFITSAVLGGVTTKVIRSTTIPVLTIAPGRARDFLDKIWDSTEHGHQSTLSRQQSNSYKYIDKEIGAITTIAALLDGSELAEDVLPYVVRLAQALTLEVVLLRVVANELPYLEPSGAMIDFGANFQAIDDALIGEAERYLDEKAKVLEKAGLKVRAQVLRGAPVPAIIDYTQQNQISMIAMTTHGRTGLIRLILGSVTDSLIRASGRPVLVVPPRLLVPSHEGKG
jgi:nucleotide-binding universal stress UspA family protein